MSESQEEMSVDEEYFTASEDNDDDEVEVVAVVPPSREPEDVWDVQGRPCPICLKDLDNGDKIMVMSCSGNHFLCKDCHVGYGHHDRQMIGDTYAVTLFEAVRQAEGAEKCPVCRQMSHCAVEARAQTYYPGSGASDDPIMID